MKKITKQIIELIDQSIIPQMVDDGFDSDMNIVKSFKSLIESSKHYSLPDGGRLMEITDFNVPFENGFSFPQQCVTVDFYDDYGNIRFLLCVKTNINEFKSFINDGSILDSLLKNGSKSFTIIISFEIDQDSCGINPVIAILPDNCINNEELEFFPCTILRQTASIINIKDCMASITEDIFVVYDLGISLSCSNVKKINRNSMKGFVRNVDGVRMWENIINLQCGVQ